MSFVRIVRKEKSKEKEEKEDEETLRHAELEAKLEAAVKDAKASREEALKTS